MPGNMSGLPAKQLSIPNSLNDSSFSKNYFPEHAVKLQLPDSSMMREYYNAQLAMREVQKSLDFEDELHYLDSSPKISTRSKEVYEEHPSTPEIFNFEEQLGTASTNPLETRTASKNHVMFCTRCKRITNVEFFTGQKPKWKSSLMQALCETVCCFTKNELGDIKLSGFRCLQCREVVISHPKNRMNYQQTCS